MSIVNGYRPKGGALVVPSDTTDINPLQVAQELYIGVAGALKIMTEDGSTLTYNTWPAGSIFPMRTVRVYATGTTATNIIAHY